MASNPLLSYYIVVRLQPNEENEGQVDAVVDYRYPPGELPKSDKTLMALITQFCFPDKEKFPKLKLGSKNKKFTFVVTNIEGVKRFGYCRRELVGDIWQGKRWAVCHCILSLSPCHPLFDAILETGSKLASKDLLEPYCQNLQNQHIPLPGDSISVTLTTNTETGAQTTYKFGRPADDQSLSGFADFSALLDYLDPFTLLNVLTSLLLERRVIFVSSKLSVLSSCVQGVVALLYPFVWQHVFIPVLPLGMIQFVCAPVPFVVGLLQHHLPDLENYSDSMEEVLLVDIDSSNVLPPAVDYRMLPEALIRSFNTSVHLAQRALKKGGKRKDKEKDKDKDKDEEPSSAESTAQQLLELGCVDFLAQLMGPYKMFLTKTNFDKEGFAKNQAELKQFREAFAGSQMFEQFIVQRQSTLQADRAADGRFERRLTITKTLNLGTLQTSANVVGLKSDLGLNVSSENDPIVAAMNLDINEVILRTGWLAKFGKGLKGHWAASRGQDTTEVGSWQARYFRLTWTKLHYFRYRQDTLAAGTIDLNTVYSAEYLESYKGRENVLEIKTPERIYYVYSANPADLSNWRDVLQYRVRENDFTSSTAASQQQQQAYQEQLAQARGKNVKQLISGVRSGSIGNRNETNVEDVEESSGGKKKGLKSKIKGLISKKHSADDSTIPSSTSPNSSPKPAPRSNNLIKTQSTGVVTADSNDLLKRATVDERIFPQSRPRGLSRDDSTLPPPSPRKWQSGRPTNAVPVAETAQPSHKPPLASTSPPLKSSGGAKVPPPSLPPKPTHMRGHEVDPVIQATSHSSSAFQPPPSNRVQANARRFAADFSPDSIKGQRRETMFVPGSSPSTHNHAHTDALQRSSTSPNGFAPPSGNSYGTLRGSGNRQAAASMRLPASSSQALAAHIQQHSTSSPSSTSSSFAPPSPSSGGALKRTNSGRPRSIQSGLPLHTDDVPVPTGGVAKMASLFDGGAQSAISPRQTTTFRNS
eukprot:TRINITY_DN5100_c0_g3_i1.p1 TRINITY_DN5100_c0_g3~~TRINITY_DN5100_c0_g3_i1.p1  ORF type:complete len:983 (-),score=166.94 TRINITY_DN5100_c0_g3_i1:1155-4103(-)